MAGGLVFKIYLAERVDGVRYVGCTKNSPQSRLHENFHPLRWNGIGSKPSPEADCFYEILYHTTDVEKARAYETWAVLEYNTMRPHGRNSRVASGYPTVRRAPPSTPWFRAQQAPLQGVSVPTHVGFVSLHPSSGEG